MGNVTRIQLRDDIRQDLAAWPLAFTLDAVIDALTDTVTFADDLTTNFIEQRSLIEVGTEIMRVIDVPQAGRSVRVIRGYMNTAKAFHSKGDTANIWPSWGWTDYELNQRIIPQAMQWLRPFSWIEQVSANFTWGLSTQEAAAPAGVGYPNGDFPYMLEVSDTDGVWKQFLGWQLYGTTFKFNKKASSDHALRARSAHFQPVLTDDTTTLDDDNFREAIVKYAAHLCLNALKTNRVRYADYAAALNDRASTPDELIRVAFDMKNQAIVSREEHAFTKPARFGSTFGPRAG